jgi:hypothetical protein
MKHFKGSTRYKSFGTSELSYVEAKTLGCPEPSYEAYCMWKKITVSD